MNQNFSDETDVRKTVCATTFDLDRIEGVLVLLGSGGHRARVHARTERYSLHRGRAGGAVAPVPKPKAKLHRRATGIAHSTTPRRRTAARIRQPTDTETIRANDKFRRRRPAGGRGWCTSTCYPNPPQQRQHLFSPHCATPCPQASSASHVDLPVRRPSRARAAYQPSACARASLSRSLWWGRAKL